MTRASPERTAAFRAAACTRGDLRTSLSHFRRAGEIWCSSIGLSLANGDTADALVAKAIAYGINVFEAAPAMQSALGRALRSAPREQLTVVALGGMLTDIPTPFGARRMEIETRYVARGILDWSDLTVSLHCLAPAYLAHELERTREQLGTIDAYLLDRPEIHLAALPPREFRMRMMRAFETLERACEEDRLASYGLHVSDPRSPLSLDELMGWAREVGGEAHHLRALRVSVSIASPHAIALRNQRGRSLLAAARDHGLFVLAVHEPLDGTLEHAYRSELPGLVSDEQRALQFARSAPAVGTVLVAAGDLDALQEAAEVARIPPAAEQTILALLEAASSGT